MSSPRLLLVNDDGIGAIGLQKLRTAADSVSDDVWTVAPAAERSGASNSISLTQPLRARQLSEREFAVDGTPADCVAMIDAVAEKVPREKLAAHFHDTYGQSLANIMAVMERGIAVFDTAVAGLGGCPYAKGASGNVGTEDVIYLMNGLGIAHGVDLGAIAQAGREICAALGREPASKVAQALKATAV